MDLSFSTEISTGTTTNSTIELNKITDIVSEAI